MNVKLLKTEQDYKDAIYRLEALGDMPNFASEQDLINEFELLSKLIEDYENENYFIEKGDPIEIIKLKMDYMGLAQKDLVPIIGSKGVVSEVINKKRGLSKLMIRNLSEFLGVSQEILNVDYELNDNDIKPKSLDNFSIKKKLDFLTPKGIDTNIISKRIRTRGVTLAICR